MDTGTFFKSSSGATIIDGFFLLLGHLIGDYIAQNDWMAKNKVTNSWACGIHCLCYTCAVYVCSFWWMPWWGVAVCFIAHFPMDRFRLAAWWMKNISGQEYFASKEHPMFPWSIVVVDNVGHLATLGLIAAVARF